MSIMPSPYHYHASASMREIKQYSSVDLYYSYFDLLKTLISCHCPDICAQYFLSTFINGLKPAFWVYVFQYQPHNVLDAYELALIYEYSLRSKKSFSLNVGDRNKDQNFSTAAVPTFHSVEELVECSSTSSVGSEGNAKNDSYEVASIVPSVLDLEDNFLSSARIPSSMSTEIPLVLQGTVEASGLIINTNSMDHGDSAKELVCVASKEVHFVLPTTSIQGFHIRDNNSSILTSPIPDEILKGSLGLKAEAHVSRIFALNIESILLGLSLINGISTLPVHNLDTHDTPIQSYMMSSNEVILSPLLLNMVIPSPSSYEIQGGVPHHIRGTEGNFLQILKQGNSYEAIIPTGESQAGISFMQGRELVLAMSRRSSGSVASKDDTMCFDPGILPTHDFQLVLYLGVVFMGPTASFTDVAVQLCMHFVENATGTFPLSAPHLVYIAQTRVHTRGHSKVHISANQVLKDCVFFRRAWCVHNTHRVSRLFVASSLVIDTSCGFLLVAPCSRGSSGWPSPLLVFYHIYPFHCDFRQAPGSVIPQGCTRCFAMGILGVSCPLLGQCGFSWWLSISHEHHCRLLVPTGQLSFDPGILKCYLKLMSMIVIVVMLTILEAYQCTNLVSQRYKKAHSNFMSTTVSTYELEVVMCSAKLAYSSFCSDTARQTCHCGDDHFVVITIIKQKKEGACDSFNILSVLHNIAGNSLPSGRQVLFFLALILVLAEAVYGHLLSGKTVGSNDGIAISNFSSFPNVLLLPGRNYVIVIFSTPGEQWDYDSVLFFIKVIEHIESFLWHTCHSSRGIFGLPSGVSIQWMVLQDSLCVALVECTSGQSASELPALHNLLHEVFNIGEVFVHAMIHLQGTVTYASILPSDGMSTLAFRICIVFYSSRGYGSMAGHFRGSRSDIPVYSAIIFNHLHLGILKCIQRCKSDVITSKAFLQYGILVGFSLCYTSNVSESVGSSANMGNSYVLPHNVFITEVYLSMHKYDSKGCAPAIHDRPVKLRGHVQGTQSYLLGATDSPQPVLLLWSWIPTPNHSYSYDYILVHSTTSTFNLCILFGMLGYTKFTTVVTMLYIGDKVVALTLSSNCSRQISEASQSVSIAGFHICPQATVEALQTHH